MHAGRGHADPRARVREIGLAVALVGRGDDQRVGVVADDRVGQRHEVVAGGDDHQRALLLGVADGRADLRGLGVGADRERRAQAQVDHLRALVGGVAHPTGDRAVGAEALGVHHPHRQDHHPRRQPGATLVVVERRGDDPGDVGSVAVLVARVVVTIYKVAPVVAQPAGQVGVAHIHAAVHYCDGDVGATCRLLPGAGRPNLIERPFLLEERVVWVGDILGRANSRRATTDERRATSDDRRPASAGYRADDRRPTTDDRRPAGVGVLRQHEGWQKQQGHKQEDGEGEVFHRLSCC